MTKGIDVSHWQGTIDWNKVKAAGIEFAIIKAGGSDAGTYTDSKWEANYKGAKAAGIPIGAYFFCRQGLRDGCCRKSGCRTLHSDPQGKAAGIPSLHG